MANLAYGLIPIEDWKNAENATNGSSKNYTGSKGFAYKKWPCTYTLDLKEPKKIKHIRFLLWDGLGTGSIRNNRRYQYILKASIDGTNWLDLYTTDKEGTNGWQVFKISNSLDARYIRLDAISNTANNDFHIVEFEVHDGRPPLISAELRTSKSINIKDRLSQPKRKDEFELKDVKKDRWDNIKKLGIIIGILVPTITTFFLIRSIYWIEKTELTCNYLDVEKLTKDDIEDIEPEIKATYYYQGNEINNLWRVRINIVNTSKKTIIGEGESKNTISDSISLNVIDGYNIIDTKLINSDLSHFLNNYGNALSIQCSQWRKSESLEYYLYVTVDSTSKIFKPFLNEYNNKRQLLEGDIYFTGINDKTNSRSIDYYLPKYIIKIINIIGTIIFLTLTVILVLAFPVIFFDYIKWRVWKRFNYRDYVKFISTKNLDYSELMIKELLRNPNSLSESDWEGFEGDKFPYQRVDIIFHKLKHFLLTELAILIFMILFGFIAAELILVLLTL